MNCPKCNAPLDSDSKFCVSCGASLSEYDIAPNSYTEHMAISETPTTENKPSFFSDRDMISRIVALVVGTVLIIIGIVRISSAGTSISSTSFGADFYTYTYQGIVAISEILASIEVTLGWVIVAIGAAIDMRALRR